MKFVVGAAVAAGNPKGDADNRGEEIEARNVAQPFRPRWSGIRYPTFIVAVLVIVGDGAAKLVDSSDGVTLLMRAARMPTEPECENGYQQQKG